MTVAKYALFRYEPYEASGGWNDFVGIFTLESAQAEAESDTDRDLVCHVVDLSVGRIVKRGRWEYDPPNVRGQIETWRYEWKDAAPC